MRRRDSRAVATLTAVSLQRRRIWRWMLLPAAPWVAGEAWAQLSRVTSSRLWPATDYTRLIVETNAPVGHVLGVLRNPDRIVLDVNGVDPSNELAQLPSRVQPSDPYIAAIRVAPRSAT